MQNRPWLAQYPAGVPAEIDTRTFASLKDVLAASCARFADRPAYQLDGHGDDVPAARRGQPRLCGLAAEGRRAASAATASR